MGRRGLLVALLCASFVVAADGVALGLAPTTAREAAGKSDAGAGTYQVVCDTSPGAAPTTVTLSGGRWQDPRGSEYGTVQLRGSQLLDATGDGQDDVVVELVCYWGGTGNVPNVIVMSNDAVNATVLGSFVGFTPSLDDGTAGRLVIWKASPLGNDPQCCPSRYERFVYAFRDGTFTSWRVVLVPASSFTGAPVQPGAPTTFVTAPGSPTALGTAGSLFSVLNPNAHQGICGGDFSTCPASDDLKGALRAYRIRLGSQDDAAVLCRCPYGQANAVSFTENAPLPPKLRGKPGYAAIKVDLDYGDVFSIFVLAHKEADGTWRAIDTYCAPEGGKGSAYTNRMTQDPQPCAGSTTGPVATARSFGPSTARVIDPSKQLPTCARPKQLTGTNLNRTTRDFTACPVTPELAATLEAHAAFIDPFCRCQNGPTSVTYSTGGPLPTQFAGKPGYVVVDARLDEARTMSFLLVRQGGRWILSDLYCAATPIDADPYGNRLTPTSAKPCALTPAPTPSTTNTAVTTMAGSKK